MDYETKTGRKMQQIANTVDKLDDTLKQYQETDSRVKGYFEQQKALHEIKSILRKSDDIEDLHRDEAMNDVNQIGLAENNEDIALDRINTQLMHLDDTLDTLQDGEDKTKSYAIQQQALQEIRNTLQTAGHYGDQSGNGISAPENWSFE